MGASEQGDKKLQVFLQRFMVAFVLCQPLLDILTSLQTRAGHSLTIGLVLRSVFMMAVVLYAFFGLRSGDKILKVCKVYLVALCLFCGVFLLYQISSLGTTELMENIKSTIKVFYFPFVLVGLYMLYKQHKVIVSPRIITCSLLLYCVVLFVAFVTKTSFDSYAWGYGYNGWFYAASEIGVVLCILAPFAVFRCVDALQNEKTIGKRFVFPIVALLLICFSVCFIGTKTPILGVIPYTMLLALWSIIVALSQKKPIVLRHIVSCLCIFVCIVGMYAVSPLRQNMSDTTIRYDNIFDDETQQDTPLPESEQPLEKPTAPENEEEKQTLQDGIVSDEHPILDFILSNRLIIFEPAIREYTNGTVLQKIMGIGYYSLDTSYSLHKSIEMDFVSVWLRHGILGLILYILPIIALLGFSIKVLCKKFLSCFFSLEYCTALFSTLISFAIAFLAGHTVSAPAVSTFVVFCCLRLIQQNEKVLYDKGE